MLATVLPGDMAAMRCRCRVMLETALPGRLGHGAMLMPSHAGDGAVGVTWPQRDVDAKSCW
jgi:hypothetical protein